MKEGFFMDRTLNSMISLILLAYPILSIPSIIKSKKENGYYFSESRFFIPKRVGYGIGINMRNKYGFFTLVVIGLLFLFLGIWLP
ncbi:hypothetical protein RV09_GL002876 [Enterococcus moraviensis]|nr:hypothetical protein RV09_GL002876 [Enterococcus moraviensis]